MNQEFMLKATPSIARRLVKLAQVSNTIVDAHIHELARTQNIADREFDALPLKTTEEQRAAVRNLVDYDLRAVLLADMHDKARLVSLVTAKITKHLPITVVAQYKQRWETYAVQLGLSHTRDPEGEADVLLIERKELVQPAVMNNRRKGIMIYEAPDDYLQAMSEDGGITMSSGPLREFERVIFIRNVGAVTQQMGSWGITMDTIVSDSVKVLFPNAPNSLLLPQTSNMETLRQRGFKRFRSRDLYFMFNVVTDLLETKIA